MTSEPEDEQILSGPLKKLVEASIKDNGMELMRKL